MLEFLLLMQPVHHQMIQTYLSPLTSYERSTKVADIQPLGRLLNYSMLSSAEKAAHQALLQLMNANCVEHKLPRE